MIETFQIAFSGLKTYELVLLLVFGVLFLVRLIYNIVFTGKVIFRKKTEGEEGNQSPVSLLMTVRNEEPDLKNNLPAILNISNAEFEVVAIDDFSEDNSLTVLGLFRKDNDKLKVSSLSQETRFSRKLAQNIALKAAKNDWVMVIPVSVSGFSGEWLPKTASFFGEDKTVVINYTSVLTDKSFFNLLYRVENFFQHVKSAGFVLNGMPFVYSEDNVAFRKDEYFKAGGYGQKIKEPFANLELLVNSFIKKKSSTITFSDETAITITLPIEKADYLELLKKSIRIEKNLSGFNRFILFFEEFTRLLFIPSIIAVIIFLFELWIIIALLAAIKTVTYLLIINKLSKRLNERKIFISSLIYDLLMPYFKLIYRWHFNQVSRNQKWRNKN